MKREINEKFEYRGISYVVREADIKFPSKCTRCGFYDRVYRRCRGTLCVTGDCRKRWRDDKKEVIFEKQ